MGFLLQLKLLMWKNFILRRRQKFRCVVELLWPLCLFLLLMWVRSKGFQSKVHECHFEDKPLPSSGQVLFYQGLLCAFNNTCHQYYAEAEKDYKSMSSSKFYTFIDELKYYRELASSNSTKYIADFTLTLSSLAEALEGIDLAHYCSSGNCTSEETLIEARFEETIPTTCNVNEVKVNKQRKGSPSDDQFEKLIPLHNDLKRNIEDMEPILKLINLIETIEKTYNNMTALLKEAPMIDNFLVNLHHFCCGNQSKITLEMLLEGRRATSYETYLDRLMETKTVVKYQYDPEATAKCNSIYEHLETTHSLQMFWRVLKPYARGKIVYSPNSPVVKRIIKQIKAVMEPPSFPSFDLEKEALQKHEKALHESLEKIELIMNQTQLALKTIDASKDPCKSLLFSAIESTVDTAHKITSRLYEVTRKFSYKQTFTIGEEAYTFAQLSKCYKTGQFEGYDSEEEASIRSLELCERNSLLAQINFLDLNEDSLKPFTTYKIRMNFERVPNPNSVVKSGPNYRPYTDLKFITFGFIYIQDMVEKSIIKELTGVDETPGYVLKQLPHPCYVDDWFMSSLADMFPLFMMLSWVYTCSMIIKSIVYEKEQRLKETMRVLGLSNGIHWLGWFLDSIIPMVVTCCMLSFVLVFGGILANADIGLVIVYLAAYSLSTISLSFLISVFFSKANLAASSGGIIFFLSYLPFPCMEYWYDFFNVESKVLLCLSSNVAFGLGSKYFAMRELEGIGARWSNIADSPIYEDTFNIAIIICILLFDSVLYFVLTWYIEGIWPGQYGIPKPWDFPFKKTYWFSNTELLTEKNISTEDSTTLHGDHFETEPTREKKGVVISNLSKVYKNGKVAVKNLNINFYENQITAFLGRNGAGKTTTISILTGLFPPSTGTAYIYGLDIRTKMEIIRKSLGVCPQHNILFGDLTVQEHLWFFGRLKGHNPGDVQIEMQQMLADLELTDKKSVKAKYLSGGMKRKLSIAIAFIGGSRTVILDEPTAGVDTYSRTGIWDLLLKYKKGRTVIMTTHIMSEADLLGDRIAIFANGKLLCSGSSSFLKNRFGKGYILTLDHYSSETQATMTENETDITKGIVSIIPGARLIEHFGSELKYSLPKISENIEKYGALFNYLDSNKTNLGIRSFGIADTTLEEIFLQMVDECDKTDGIPNSSDLCKEIKSEVYEDFLKPAKRRHILPRQFAALHTKRFHHYRRNKIAFMSEVVLPALFVGLSMWVTKVLPAIQQPKAMIIDVSNCTDCISFFTEEPNSSIQSQLYTSQLLSNSGLGIACVGSNETRSKLCGDPHTQEATVVAPYAQTNENCSCQTGQLVCPTSLLNSLGTPETIIMANGQKIQNLTNETLPDWLIKSWPIYGISTGGGYTFGVRLPLKNVSLSKAFSSSSIEDKEGLSKPAYLDNIKIWFNNKWVFAPVAYLNAINNLVLRTLVKNGSNEYGIRVINHPVNYTKAQYQSEILYKSATALLHSIAVIFAMSFVPASFIMYLIEERVSNSKHLQFVSGVHWALYWVEAFVWDMMCYSISAFLCVSVFYLFDEKAYIANGNVSCIILLLLLYGWASIPLMYPASFFFSVPSSAFVAISCLNIFIGITTTTSTFVLRVFIDKDLEKIENSLREFFTIFPHFCLGEGIMKMAESYLLKTTMAAYDVTLKLDPYAWSSLGKNMLSMFLAGIVFFSFILLYERFRHKDFLSEKLEPEPETLENGTPLKVPKCKDIEYANLVSMDPPQNQEDDVEAEKKRVLANQCDDILILRFLSKVYKGRKGKPAVNQLCLGVKRGECFGLLGLNGAGKTTTFKMLTGDTSITFGDALVLGHSARSNLTSVRTFIGYCPQFDALDSKLTPKDHLEFYAKIRGIPSKKIKQVVENMLCSFDLTQYKNVKSAILSGGNKRKLSTAIALLGNPQLIFLDEPTSGMDPKARRFLWSRIRKSNIEGRAVVLTTHSMNECEALCSRLTIMVNGEFKCLGSIQHLKNKYGRGYNMVLRTAEENVEAARAYVAEKIPLAVEEATHFTQMRYKLDTETAGLIIVLEILENAKAERLIHDYSLSQRSLEEVFLHFVNSQSSENAPSMERFTFFRPLISKLTLSPK